LAVKRTRIGYADYSGGDANFIIGCTPESPGCAHCYARAIYARQGREEVFSRPVFYEDKLRRLYKARFEPGDQPFRRGPGSRPLVFVVDMGDIFHMSVKDEWILKASQVMSLRADVDWLILTKRAKRMCDWTQTYLPQGWPENVWVGASVENTTCALRRIHYVRWTKTRGPRWLSVEPMLEGIPLPAGFWRGIDWVVCGAESGNQRREFNPLWALNLYDRCRAQGIAFFGKQDSGRFPGEPLLLRGKEIKEWPR